MMGSLTSKKECMIHGVGLVTRVRGFCLRHCGEGPPCARALRGDRIEACSTAGWRGHRCAVRVCAGLTPQARRRGWSTALTKRRAPGTRTPSPPHHPSQEKGTCPTTPPRSNRPPSRGEVCRKRTSATTVRSVWVEIEVVWIVQRRPIRAREPPIAAGEGRSGPEALSIAKMGVICVRIASTRTEVAHCPSAAAEEGVIAASSRLISPPHQKRALPPPSRTPRRHFVFLRGGGGGGGEVRTPPPPFLLPVTRQARRSLSQHVCALLLLLTFCRHTHPASRFLQCTTTLQPPLSHPPPLVALRPPVPSPASAGVRASCAGFDYPVCPPTIFHFQPCV